MSEDVMDETELFEQHQAEINEMFDEKGFFERLSLMSKGLKMPRSSREYKIAKTELQRLMAPLIAILLPVIGVLVLIVVTAVQSEKVSVVQVEVGKIEEKQEELQEEEEPEPEEIDMTQDIDVTVDVSTDVTPMANPAPPSPNPGGEPDKVAAAPSPVTMSAVSGTVKMRGIGDGDGGGFGTLIGTGKGGRAQNTEGCLIGVIVDFKSNPDGTPNPAYNQGEFYYGAIRKLASANFSASALAEYFVPERRVALSKVLIPSQPAENGPKAFGVSDVMKPSGFVVYYHGPIVPAETKKFRFWGSFDDVLLIQVNGKTVLDANWNGKEVPFGTGWKAPTGDGLKVRPFQTGAYFTPSDWIDGVAGKALDLTIVVGERPGGLVGGFIFIQVEGETYPKDGEYTRFPVFASRRMSYKEKEAIQERSQKYPVNLENIPLFNSRKATSELKAATKNDVKVEVDI